MSLKQAEVRTVNRSFWPLIGLVMLIAIGAISWVLAPDLIRFLAANIDGFRGNELQPRWRMQLAFAAIIFTIIASIGALIVAAAVPKSKMRVQDAGIKKERDDMVKAIDAKKRRRRKLAREMSRADHE